MANVFIYLRMGEAQKSESATIGVGDNRSFDLASLHRVLHHMNVQ
jgi:hypothetical protein